MILMNIIINRETKVPIYLQIKKQIADKISCGELPANYILPAERILSSELNVNRSTIIKAYMELKAEGLVESRVGSGTVVLTPLSKESDETDRMYIPPIRWNQLESRSFVRSNDDSINSILSVFGKEKIISFASGISPKDSYELELMKELQIKLLDKHKEEVFMPTPVDGSTVLKNTIKQLLKQKGISAGNKQIMITSGSQQGIEFFGKLMIEPGDVVIVEEPTFIGAMQAFESYGAKIIGVPMNEDGMRLDILESYIIKYRPKFIYTQPNYQNPTGITMSIEKSKELLRLAYYYNIPILEDDPYGELNYEGPQMPSLKSLDNNDYVVYLSSFSKIICFSSKG
jgi:DNA-binding transcriptional MocR family regulator